MWAPQFVRMYSWLEEYSDDGEWRKSSHGKARRVTTPGGVPGVYLQRLQVFSVHNTIVIFSGLQIRVSTGSFLIQYEWVTI
ncbi:hypothetical protein BD410DRAFT_519345 [Rickenella mellea]|uniref:Uncharacterized protein n=1 Tax=Rickenella mellea TaxID=50990 RepID=A0A4Y7QHR2_9AGAM|nr:hypothetical protein BD410DRAFT_519345 [Rickenella mellea]